MPIYARYPSLAARTVLVTGGATGIGATLVAQFAAQSARVAFIDIDEPAGHALAAALSGTDTPPKFITADLTDIVALNAAIEQVRQHFGPITVLLNNAANDRRHSIDETTPESWDAGIAVNLKHQFFAAKAVVADMQRAGGGSIVNFGSVSWMLKQGGMPVYTTAKSAVQGLTCSLARLGAVQHPRQHPRSGLGYDGEAAPPLGGRQRPGRHRPRAMHQPAAAVRAHRAHGAVSGG